MTTKTPVGEGVPTKHWCGDCVVQTIWIEGKRVCPACGVSYGRPDETVNDTVVRETIGGPGNPQQSALTNPHMHIL